MKRALEFAAVRLVALIVSLLPMAVVRRVGAGLGRMAYRLDRARRRTALENLAAAFPSKPERERRALARAMFAHFGSLLLELLKFANYTTAEMRNAVEVEGSERARQAYAQNRGVLFFTGHFGYWEIHAVAECVPQPCHFRRIVLRVAVGVEDPVARGRLEAGAQRAAVPAVAVVVYDLHLRVGARELVRDLRSRVDAAVVDDDDLEVVGQRLGRLQRRDDETRNRPAVVVRGKKHAEPWPGRT